MSERRFQSVPIQRFSGSATRSYLDPVAVEEPLEIQVVAQVAGEHRLETVTVTMRTPGHDEELAVGFLLGEGLIRSPDDVVQVHTRVPHLGRQIRVVLRPGLELNLPRVDRNFTTNSSCGFCGKTNLSSLDFSPWAELPAPSWQVSPALLCSLPQRLQFSQEVFQQTGGLHAAGIFNRAGEPRWIREDIGRHNAVDKVIGAAFIAREWPLREHLLVVSGRASFELIQKAIVSGLEILVAVGAPSSLAVEIARQYGATLVGFTKATGCNVYSGSGRLTETPPSKLLEAISTID